MYENLSKDTLLLLLYQVRNYTFLLEVPLIHESDNFNSIDVLQVFFQRFLTKLESTYHLATCVFLTCARGYKLQALQIRR